VRTNLQDNNGVLSITNENPKDGQFEVILDAQTGEVMDFNYVYSSIDKMYSFMFAARARYRKYMAKNAIDNFSD
jgi:hypothetical protein